jgi:hypothetical protein
MRTRKRWIPVGCAVASIVACLACGAAVQEAIIKPPMANDSERATAFEATARLLDEHPEWVDQMYAVVQRHDRTRRRMLEDATRDLSNEGASQEQAALLAKDPAALRQILISTVDASKADPEARRAFAHAVAERSEVVADVLTDDPDAVRATLIATVESARTKKGARRSMAQAIERTHVALGDIATDSGPALHVMMLGTVDAAQRKPAARAALEQAVEERADALAEMIAEDPRAMKAMTKAVARHWIEARPDLRQVLVRVMTDER